MARRQVQKPNGNRQADNGKDIIQQVLNRTTGSDWVREYRFHPKRLWRFDYACPQHKVAVEIEGNIFAFGRHNRPLGMVKDMEKYNSATSLGWSVLRFTPPATREELSRFGTAGCMDLIAEVLKQKEGS